MNYNNTLTHNYTILLSIIYGEQYSSLYNELDNLLLRKRFDNACDLSLTENLLHVNTYNLTTKNINKIISDFIKTSKNFIRTNNRNLYEIIKIGNISSEKLKKAIDTDTHKKLIKALDNVSRETTLISFDFLILRIYDNFILKSPNLNTKKEYIRAKDNIIKKILTFEYEKEYKEKETTFLCWVDRLLYAVINKEITPSDFVLLNKKIFGLIAKTIYYYWKVLHSVNYILLQQDFSANPDMRLFKKEVFKAINNMYNIVDMSESELKDLTARILTKKTPNKEDYYYLFDCLKITAKKDELYKLFCLKICKYIINYNYQHNIFCYRFIRKYFIESFFDIINNPISNKDILIEEIGALISLFHIDVFFCFNRSEIFENIIKKIVMIDERTINLTYKSFYKFYNSIDYIMSENIDIITPDILKMFNIKNDDRPKLIRCFKYLLYKYS